MIIHNYLIIKLHLNHFNEYTWIFQFIWRLGIVLNFQKTYYRISWKLHKISQNLIGTSWVLNEFDGLLFLNVEFMKMRKISWQSKMFSIQSFDTLIHSCHFSISQFQILLNFHFMVIYDASLNTNENCYYSKSKNVAYVYSDT